MQKLVAAATIAHLRKNEQLTSRIAKLEEELAIKARQVRRLELEVRELNRELKEAREQTRQARQEMKALLLEIKEAADRARTDSVPTLPPAAQHGWTVRYADLVAEGLRLNPPAPTAGKVGRPKRSPAGNLALRLATHQAETLAFMTDLRVPFDNNPAERDLRMMKLRQKISGCFRSMTAVDRFCLIRSYVSTLRKQRVPILAALTDAFCGHPPVPALT